MLDNTIAKDHPRRVLLDLEIEQLKARYGEFITGAASKGEVNSHNGARAELYIPFGDLPDLGVRYARLLREVKLQVRLIEFLLPLYEQAKIEPEVRRPPLSKTDT